MLVQKIWLYHRKRSVRGRFQWKGGFPGGSDVKESTWNAGNLGLIPGLGRSPGEGSGYPFQYYNLENSMDRGAWQATVQGLQRVRHDWVTFTHSVKRMLEFDPEGIALAINGCWLMLPPRHCWPGLWNCSWGWIIVFPGEYRNQWEKRIMKTWALTSKLERIHSSCILD